MVVDCTLLGDIQGVNGNGTLTTIKFYIKKTGECLLDLYDTILLNSAEQTIEHSTTDGYFYAVTHNGGNIGGGSSATKKVVK